MTDQERIEKLEREVTTLREALAHTLTACSKTPYMIGIMNAMFMMINNKQDEGLNQDEIFGLVNKTQAEFDASIKKAIEIIWEAK